MSSVQFVIRIWSEGGVLGLIRPKTIREVVEIVGAYTGSAHHLDYVVVRRVMN